jgi:hypothetical protein
MRPKTAVLLLALAAFLCGSTSFGQLPYPYEHRNEGMALGAVAGALTGAAIGEHNHKTLAGAAIGTAAGALTGAAIGDSIDTDIARRDAIAQQVRAERLTRAVTVPDVIAMTRSRLSDSVIVTQIQTNGVAYQPRANDLVVMSQAGVSDVVIRAMQTAPVASSPPVVVPAYREPVIVEQRYIVRPYPAPVFFYPGPYHPYPHHYAPGIHWGITIGH